MEFLAIIIGLLVLMKSGLLNSLGGTFNGPSSSIPYSTGAPLTAQQTQAELGQVGQLGSELSAGINLGTQLATSLSKSSSDNGSGSGSSSDQSAFATTIGQVAGVVGQVAQVLLAQHTARLKGAIAENQLIPATVNAFDADMRQIADAYNSKQATAAQCISALRQMDQSIYNYMKSNAVGPGRAWRETSAPYTPACNKGCTTECCIYYNDIKRAIYDPGTSAGGTFGGGVMGMIPVLQKGSGTVYVPKVYPPPAQYGNFSRETYQLTLA